MMRTVKPLLLILMPAMVVYCSDVTEFDGLVIKFLLTANATQDTVCMATVVTPFLQPNTSWNDTKPIAIGQCDKGPLTYTVKPATDPNSYSKLSVEVTFYTTVISAMPPVCSIEWNGTYVFPQTTDPSESPLPGCWTSDSQEGWHPMQYWFRILEWDFI
ncbi:hypothetical protein BaRGS_00034626 [Batillaria attramentaria]|uniref:Uncharacterized protein n=1 Tax=Batillaria attramentaria TaxID=370345 RepID=A0ABD0JGM7_9CAEN